MVLLLLPSLGITSVALSPGREQQRGRAELQSPCWRHLSGGDTGWTLCGRSLRASQTCQVPQCSSEEPLFAAQMCNKLGERLIGAANETTALELAGQATGWLLNGSSGITGTDTRAHRQAQNTSFISGSNSVNPAKYLIKWTRQNDIFLDAFIS